MENIPARETLRKNFRNSISRLFNNALVAQLEERRFPKPGAVGSSPAERTTPEWRNQADARDLKSLARKSVSVRVGSPARGGSSTVEPLLPKQQVAGSIPVLRSRPFFLSGLAEREGRKKGRTRR